MSPGCFLTHSQTQSKPICGLPHVQSVSAFEFIDQPRDFLAADLTIK